MVEIMLVDDHALVRDGIRSLLEGEEDIKVTYEASDGNEAYELLKKVTPQLLIVDIRMPIMNGIELVQKLVQEGIETSALMLSMHDSEEYVIQSIDAGASGYLLKDAGKEEFIKAIRTILSGEYYFSGDISKYLIKRVSPSNNKNSILSPTSQAIDIPRLTKRELQILELAVLGNSNQEIADILEKSKRTIEAHRFNLMKKLDVKNLASLIKKANDLNLIK